MKKSGYIECGKIINTHSFRGAVKIDPWCNTPKDFTALKRVFLPLANGGYTEKKMTHASVFKQFVIAELEGVDDMDKAMLLKNTVLYAAREDFKLKDGEYFISDLEGLDVIDEITAKVFPKTAYASYYGNYSMDQTYGTYKHVVWQYLGNGTVENDADKPVIKYIKVLDNYN